MSTFGFFMIVGKLTCYFYALVWRKPFVHDYCTMNSLFVFTSLKVKMINKLSKNLNMDRATIILSIQEIKKGKTFHRSPLPKTVTNKKVWDELRSEITQGYSIDLPIERTLNLPSRA